MEIEESVVGIDTGRTSGEMVAGGVEGRGGAGSRLTGGGPGVGSRGGIGDDTLEGRCCGDCVSDAISESGAFGRRIPPSLGASGGDWEFGSRGIENVETAGELNDDEGIEPEDARETVQ